MAFGVFDPDEAIREGWARDPDDEVSFDGYNAFIQITTSDGSSGFSTTNSVGATVFMSKSDGDGYVAKDLGVGKFNPTEKLDVDGTAKMLGFHLPINPTDGYVLTADTTGVGTWKQAPGAASGITPTQHRDLDQLVHVVAEDSFDEITRDSSGACIEKINNITTWNDSNKTTKIREETYTYSGIKVTQAITVQYNSSGVAAETLTEDFTYSGNKIISITRTLT